MTTTTLAPAQLTKSAIHLLVKEMGLANTARFIQQVGSGFGNYTEEREEYIGHLTVEDISASIRARKQRGEAARSARQELKFKNEPSMIRYRIHQNDLTPLQQENPQGFRWVVVGSNANGITLRYATADEFPTTIDESTGLPVKDLQFITQVVQAPDDPEYLLCDVINVRVRVDASGAPIVQFGK